MKEGRETVKKKCLAPGALRVASGPSCPEYVAAAKGGVGCGIVSCFDDLSLLPKARFVLSGNDS